LPVSPPETSVPVRRGTERPARAQRDGDASDAQGAAPAGLVLETNRLWLRRFVRSDSPFVASMFEDDAARRFYPAMHVPANAERWVQRNLDTYERDGFGLWVIVFKQGGALAGDAGLMRQSIEGREEIEVGYHLHAAWRGRGIATEAARACMDRGFANLDCPRIVSMVHPENSASHAVCTRIHSASARFWRQGAQYFLFHTERGSDCG